MTSPRSPNSLGPHQTMITLRCLGACASPTSTHTLHTNLQLGPNGVFLDYNTFHYRFYYLLLVTCKLHISWHVLFHETVYLFVGGGSPDLPATTPAQDNSLSPLVPTPASTTSTHHALVESTPATSMTPIDPTLDPTLVQTPFPSLRQVCPLYPLPPILYRTSTLTYVLILMPYNGISPPRSSLPISLPPPPSTPSEPTTYL